MFELVVVLLIFLFLASFLNPLLGLYGFFIIAYIRPQDSYTILNSIEPAQGLLIVTFISFAVHKLVSGTRLVKAKQNGAILGILFFVFISRFAVIDSISWANALKDFIKVVIVYFLIVNLVNNPKKIKYFFIFFLLLNLFIAVRYYSAYRGGMAVYHGSKPGDATLGFLANADDLGVGMVVALPFALISILYADKKILKFVSLFIAGIFMLAALATQSRGAHLGLFAVFIGTIISQIKLKKFKEEKFLVGLVIILFVLGGFIYKYRYTFQDSYNTSQEQNDSGRIGRFSTWDVGKQMIISNPITGVGRGNFIVNWRINYSPGVFGYQVAHNIILEVAAEIGLIGLVFFLYFSLYGLKEIIFIMRNYKSYLEKNCFLEMIFMIYGISLLGFYITGMFITVAFYWHVYVLVAMFVSAKNIFMKEVENEKNKIIK